MTDTTSAPPADPGPPPTAPPGLPTGSDRFFSWVSGLGIVRADGWLGGVCGGIAARLRIDPLIVRGIFVVVALLGFPALLVYAIAWALLPDTDGRIHFRELMHGRYDAAMTGVFILAIVGFVPVVPWLRNVLLWPLWALTGFAPWAWNDGSGVSVLGVLGFFFALAVIGGLVYLIVRSARSDRATRADAQTASAQPAPTVASDSGDDATAPLAASASTADSAGRAPAESATGDGYGDAVPLAASATADAAPAPYYGTDAQVADWRARQEAWRVQNDAWRRSRQDAERAARDQARRERHAHGTAFALEAEERRRVRRATRPRTSFVFVLTALGAAIVAGAIAVLTALASPASAPFAGAIGFFTAALVTALAMVVAGAIRRRSGFLTAVTLVLLVIGGVVTGAAGHLSVGQVNLGTSSAPQDVAQPFGGTYVSVGRLSDTKDVTAGDITIAKSAGYTEIWVYRGAALDLDATLGDGVIDVERLTSKGDPATDTITPRSDGTASLSVVNEAPDTAALTTQHVSIDQRSGSIHVVIVEE